MSLAGKIGAYATLLRVSNAPTALADVWMGMAVASEGLEPLGVWLCVSVASLGLYLGGMALNDWFDAELDSSERPERPIPSGRVSRAKAGWIGFGLLIVGVAAASVAAWLVRSPTPAIVALLLAGAVVAYDGALKGTAWGPVALGLCRALNGLLGMAAGFQVAAQEVSEAGLLGGFPAQAAFIAPGALCYAAAVTWFARTEASTSRRVPLALATLLAIGGIVLLACGPWLGGEGGPPLRAPVAGWRLMWGVIALVLLRRFVAAILRPEPRYVQQAVIGAIQSIVLLDAALAWGYAKPIDGLTIVLLLPVAVVLGHFVKPT